MIESHGQLTPLAVVALGMLREQPLHPYEIMRLIRQRGDERIVAVSTGTLYNTVKRLERDGLVTEVGVDRDGNRPERTTYAITEAGEAAARAWIQSELPRIDHPAEFRVALAEAHDLPREEASALLGERRGALKDHRDRLREGLGQARARGVPEQFLVEGRRESALLEAELAWLDETLVLLADPGTSWGVDELSAETRARLTAYRESVIR